MNTCEEDNAADELWRAELHRRFRAHRKLSANVPRITSHNESQVKWSTE